MPAAALGLALSAAFLHALWNLLAARAGDTVAALAIAMSIGPLLVLPLALLRWRVEPAAVPYIAVSAALELTYMVLLAAAYRRAEMSLIYPIARGMAPVFVLVLGTLLLGQAVSPMSTLGIVVVAAGVVMVRGFRSAAALRHVLLALTIAGIIASYTLVDQQGLKHADPIAYSVLITGLPGLALLGWVVAHGGRARVAATLSPSIAAAGVAGVSAYTLVLAALTMAPAALVAAVRESSVVIATAMAALVLHERVDRTRWLGSAVVAMGVGLVVLG
jgi:drug/metabolite transporter (DMT)-like permease